MPHRWLALLLFSPAWLGCTYTSFYSQSVATSAPPVPAAAVKVVRSQADLASPWTQVGSYRGSAPSVQEAMDAAKQRCGQAGAEFFILSQDPYAKGRTFRVQGICAAPTKA